MGIGDEIARCGSSGITSLLPQAIVATLALLFCLLLLGIFLYRKIARYRSDENQRRE